MSLGGRFCVAKSTGPGSVHDGGVISRSAAGGFCGGDFATVSAPDRVVTGLSDKVELIDFNLAEKENPMTDDRLPLAELAAKSGDPDFLRAIAESVLQLIMEADVDGLIGLAAMNGVRPARPGATASASAPSTRGWAR